MGATGPQGAAGINGTNGLSAYDIWINLGNSGSEQDFINSLSGQSSNSFISQLPNLAITDVNFNAVGILVSGTLLPGPSATSYGYVWSNEINPDINDNIIYANNSNTNFSLPNFTARNIFIKQHNTTYYVRGFAANDFGIRYSQQYSFTTGQYVSGEIGPGNGLIFFDKGFYSDGWRYIEKAPGNIGYKRFGCSNIDIPETNSVEMGAGYESTEAILNQCNDLLNSSNAANNYSNNGLSDWYVPSKNEASF